MPHLMLAALDPMGVIMTVLGLGFLIFFHELGHFIACRLTGTRVEAFSIGFGPKLIGWRRGNTLYKIAAIPLGGYVKMAAENPGEARSDAPDEFPNKSFLARLFIMSNGVIFNAILALALYVIAFRAGVPFPSAQLGLVRHGGPGWEAGLRPGDLVTHINGRRVLGFDDITMEVAFSGKGEVLAIDVEREGKPVRIHVRPKYLESAGMPQIQVEPSLDDRLGVAEKDSPLALAGGRGGDRVLSVNERPVTSVRDFQFLVNQAVGRAAADAKEVRVTLRVERQDRSDATFEVPVELTDSPQIGILPYGGNTVVQIAAGTAAAEVLDVGDKILSVNGRAIEDLQAYRDQPRLPAVVKTIKILRDGKPVTLSPAVTLTERELAESVVGELDTGSNRVAPRTGMPASIAGVIAGDRIVRVGNTRTDKWEDISTAIVAGGLKPVALTVLRGEQEIPITIHPSRKPKYGLIGYAAESTPRIHRETNIFSAIGVGWRRTVMAMKSVALTIRGLVTQRVSARHIGGPITLARVTYDMFDVGIGRYLYVLALISINLAILNILPIPVLDGGQIVLLCAEKLRGKPLPDRVVGYFQMVGLLLILSLLVLAFHNDIVGLLK